MWIKNIAPDKGVVKKSHILFGDNGMLDERELIAAPNWHLCAHLFSSAPLCTDMLF